jgi:predicted RNA-binding Zn ribbon-like protein
MAGMGEDPEPTAVAAMKLVAGDPCLDFVNTVGGRVPGPDGLRTTVREDKFASYPDLVAFVLRRGLVPKTTVRRLTRAAGARPGEARATLQRARALRESLHRTLRALTTGRRPLAADLARINAEVAAGRRHEALAARGGRIEWEWRPAAVVGAPLWAVSRAAAALLTSPDLAHVRQCGGDACGWLFLDRSRSGRRRWCSMEDCGNVAKVRRFRRRLAGRAQ